MRSAIEPVRRWPSPLRRRRTFAVLAVTISYRESGVRPMSLRAKLISSGRSPAGGRGGARPRTTVLGGLVYGVEGGERREKWWEGGRRERSGAVVFGEWVALW